MPGILGNGTRVVAYHRTFQQRAALAYERQGVWTSTEVGDSTKFPALAIQGSRTWLAIPRGTAGRDGPQQVSLRWSDDLRTWNETVLAAPPPPGRTTPAVVPGAHATAWVVAWVPRQDGASLEAWAVADTGAVVANATVGHHAGRTAFTGDYLGLAPLPDGGAQAVWTAQEPGAWTVRASALHLRSP